MLGKLRNEIKAIAQGNIQIALNTIVDILEVMGAESAIEMHDRNIEIQELAKRHQTIEVEEEDAEKTRDPKQEVSETPAPAGE